ncbi:CBS domain-containing protein [Thalassospiraceae bacterium LMO-JJ14]|nr:CBS domain-containing protein [Thalassospiraceae bacterium LMO-JJ14]
MKIMPDVIHDQNLLVARPEDNARHVAKAMVQRQVSSILVLDEAGKLIGIVTERDFTRRFAVEGVDAEKTTAGDIMTRDVETLSPDDSAFAALELMELRNFRHLPVVGGDGKPLGIVSIRDLYAVVNRESRSLLAKTQTYLFDDRYNLDM